jgi:hypothetical protein
MNYQGQIVTTREIVSDGIGIKQRLNLNDLAKGIYYLRVQSDNNTIIRKIVLQ